MLLYSQINTPKIHGKDFAHDIKEVHVNARQLHIARELFAQGMATSLFSHQIHPYVENVISYIIHNITNL